ncbi:MAG: flavodoxin family protein [Methanomicrobiaceae archaeon]|nr:flavodoxin family protein [Methanomicrobiaceae archaeon]
MDGHVARLRSERITTPAGEFTLDLEEEDLSEIYPGLVRYAVRIVRGEEEIAVFRTNTYEYAPQIPLDARSAAEEQYASWKEHLSTHPAEFVELLPPQKPECLPPVEAAEVVVVQGSARPGGNSSIIAEWGAEEAERQGRTSRVIYLHDLEIHPCIGCYWCYNTGHCTYEDDMTGVIHAIRQASILVICTPVYTNTVPAGLKAMVDRCQAYHARQLLTGERGVAKGLLFSVAGRTGVENFTCVVSVANAYMRNLGIEPAEPVLFDGLDEIRDIRHIPGAEERVRSAVRAVLG